MKTHLQEFIIILSLALAGSSQAQLNIPSDGSDGVFEPFTNIVVDLSQAATGVWNVNNSANAGKGIYDPDKWAVIFKYRSVNIPAGVEVRFKNHPSRAPVVWLVQENVHIDGVVNLDGQDWNVASAELHINREPGPGGFRGGARLLGQGSQLGPTGSGIVHHTWEGFPYYQTSYGNPQVLPLIGGVGGPGFEGPSSDQRRSYTGPGGGGAILMAASREIEVNGMVTCQGGRDSWSREPWLRVSGGAIRCIANVIRGAGKLRAKDKGRIRFEANSVALTQATEPETIAVPPGPTPVIWPPDDAPKARIVSIAGADAPADPSSPLNGAADLAIQNNSNVVIIVETKNFPIEGAVTVRIAPKYAGAIELKAQLAGGSFAQALWQATTTFVPGYSTLQVRTTAP